MKNNIVNIAKEYVFNLFKESDQKLLVYHNYNHTFEVASAAEEISRGLGLNEKEIELLLLSAWFHDIGYLVKYKGHEQISAEYASSFLKLHSYKEAEIEIVMSAILATQYPQKPKTLIEEILCDADFSHFGTAHPGEKQDILYQTVHLHCRIRNYLKIAFPFFVQIF